MDNLISVIVPIYKVEDYLPNCIDSILNQSYKQLEIILVDDGSPDTCPQICDEYKKKDDRIKVVHKENGGLSSARNAGIEIATGEYIAFVDSDDWLSPVMYETLIGMAKEFNADVVSCSPVIVCGDKIISRKESLNVCVHKEKERIYELLTSELRFEVWNKLFRSSIIGRTRFVNGQVYEDLYFDREVFYNARTIVVSNYSLYYYRLNRPGNTNSSFSEKRYSAFSEIQKYFELFSKEKWDSLYIPYMELAMNFCLNLYCMATKWNPNDKFSSELHKRYKMYYKDYSNKKKPGLKYLLFFLLPKVYYYLSQLHLRFVY